MICIGFTNIINPFTFRLFYKISELKISKYENIIKMMLMDRLFGPLFRTPTDQSVEHKKVKNSTKFGTKYKRQFVFRPN
jgi:hypothetical protein